MLWFDLDNSPHVPLFRPILKELSRRNISYFITARDFAQTKELLNYYNIEHTLIGTHAGKNKIKKLINIFIRSYELNSLIKSKNITLAVSHGSRSQLLLTKKLRVKSVLMLDYEFTESKIFNLLSTYLLIPVFIPDTRLKQLGFNLKKIIRYNGFKEEIYLRDFQVIPNFRKILGVDDDKVLIIIRPPSFVSNYHHRKSELLYYEGLKYFSKIKDVVCLVVSRIEADKKFVKENFNNSLNIKILDKVVDGLQLLYAADIVLSGGGTMNREAALLGTETYSYFASNRPYLDEYLNEIGRLNFINEPEDFKQIKIERKPKKEILLNSKNLVNDIVNILLEISN